MLIHSPPAHSALGSGTVACEGETEGRREEEGRKRERDKERERERERERGERAHTRRCVPSGVMAVARPCRASKSFRYLGGR